MFWILAGFVFAIFCEQFVRVSQNNKRETQPIERHTQGSLPWFGWILAGIATLGIWRLRNRRKNARL